MILHTCAYIYNLPIGILLQRTFIILEILKIYHRSVTNSIPWVKQLLNDIHSHKKISTLSYCINQCTHFKMVSSNYELNIYCFKLAWPSSCYFNFPFLAGIRLQVQLQQKLSGYAGSYFIASVTQDTPMFWNWNYLATCFLNIY